MGEIRGSETGRGRLSSQGHFVKEERKVLLFRDGEERKKRPRAPTKKRVPRMRKRAGMYTNFEDTGKKAIVHGPRRRRGRAVHERGTEGLIRWKQGRVEKAFLLHL